MKILASEHFWNANKARYLKKLDAPALNSHKLSVYLAKIRLKYNALVFI